MQVLTASRYIHLSLVQNVMDFVKMIIPNKVSIEPLVVNASRELLCAYALYQVDSLNYPDYIEYTLLNIELSACVSKNIQRIIKKTREIKFSLSEPMKEGYLYMGFDEKVDGIGYAVMKGRRCYRGEILDKAYDHFKRRLRKSGVLSLKEVNFLIEKVITPRRHLKQGVEVIDPLCRQSFSHFLTRDPNIQACAIQLLISRLIPFGDFSLSGFSDHGFYDTPCSLNALEERLIEGCHMRDYYGSEQLMTDDLISSYEADRYQTQLSWDEDQNKSQ